MKLRELTIDNKLCDFGLEAPYKVLGIEYDPEGFSVEVTTGSRLLIELSGRKALITITALPALYRALTILKENCNKKDFWYCEEVPVSNPGFMLDCSRNAVMNPKTFCELVQVLAKLGYTRVLLYMEDTYEVDGEPYFGHMRGRFSHDELRFMDSYAKSFGLELVPCIQTLAHLEHLLKWPVYFGIADTKDILLIGEQRTYELIDKMFCSLATALTSRNINIGMDEAHMVGLGKYLDINGFKDRHKTMAEHLTRVLEIAKKHGYKCSMWSDMFFRLAYGGIYYPPVCAPPFSEEVTRLVPDNVELVYWQYNETDTRRHEDMLERHLQLTSDVSFTCGIWSWMGFAPLNKHGIERIKAGVTACINKGIKSATAAMWGDNGGECVFTAVLPQIAAFAELCYTGRVDEKVLTERVRTCSNYEYNDLMLLDKFNYPTTKHETDSMANPSKYLLYNDVLLGLFDYGIDSQYKTHYRQLKEALEVTKDPADKLFKMYIILAELLQTKASLGVELKEAYDKNDRLGLERITKEEIPYCMSLITSFAQSLRKVWHYYNKALGFEVQQIRLSGVKERLNECKERVSEYLEGKIERIEELEQARLPFFINHDRTERKQHCNYYQYMTTSGIL